MVSGRERAGSTVNVSPEHGRNAAAFLVDETGTVRWSSQPFDEVFPTAKSDEDIPFYERLAALLSSADAQDIRDLAGSDAIREAIVLTCPLEGGHRYYRQYSYPVAGTGRRFEVFQEVTDRREREDRLTKFARVVSHDLRNPLDVAMGRAEILPTIADVDEETERHLQDIHDSLKRMERLIEDVLTLTRQPDMAANTEPVSLKSTVTAAWRNVDTGAASLAVGVETDSEILAHQSQLLRLFENLFRNAVQHGHTEVTVEVGLLDSDRQGACGFYVADDGPGIPESKREHIFEDGFTTAEQGTGLGLPIVCEIARSHGWTVELVEGAGARFEISGISAVES